MERVGRWLRSRTCCLAPTADLTPGARNGCGLRAEAYHASAAAASPASSSLAAASHPAATAHRAGTLSITFSGAGFLLPYFVGVLGVLRKAGVVQPGTHVAGGEVEGRKERRVVGPRGGSLQGRVKGGWRTDGQWGRVGSYLCSARATLRVPALHAPARITPPPPPGAPG